MKMIYCEGTSNYQVDEFIERYDGVLTSDFINEHFTDGKTKIELFNDPNNKSWHKMQITLYEFGDVCPKYIEFSKDWLWYLNDREQGEYCGVFFENEIIEFH